MFKLKFSDLSYLYNTGTKQALRTMAQPSVSIIGHDFRIHLPGKKVLKRNGKPSFQMRIATEVTTSDRPCSQSCSQICIQCLNFFYPQHSKYVIRLH